MGVGLQDLLPRFTYTDATADVLWSHDYEKGVVEVVEGVIVEVVEVCLNRPSLKVQGALGSFSPGMGPPKRDISFVYFLF